MSELDANRITKLCYNFYDKTVPEKNKPKKNEWTNLAAIVLQIKLNDESFDFKVVSMATGSKCLAEKDLPINGSLIHDSHAEILARRCFIRFVYNEIEELLFEKKDSSMIIEMICKDNARFSIKKNINFILFTSHTPCL
jgi:tRNA-specific adenosine deaminase 1